MTKNQAIQKAISLHTDRNSCSKKEVQVVFSLDREDYFKICTYDLSTDSVAFWAVNDNYISLLKE